MKRFLIIVALLATWGIASAQSYTQKWNSLYERTEYYDSYGRMIGYSKYNKLYDRMEYYNANGTLVKTESYNSLYDRTGQRAALAMSSKPVTITRCMIERILRTRTAM